MFPNMRRAMRGWVKKKTVVTYVQQIIDFESVLIPTDYEVWINYQPMPPERIEKKPEEERFWKWYEIFAESSLKLNKKDWIVIDDKNFQIMERNDWSYSGFIHYEVVEAFLPTTV